MATEKAGVLIAKSALTKEQVLTAKISEKFIKDREHVITLAVFLSAAFLELCPHGQGFQPNGDDIDDCRLLPGLCNHGTCINALGSFRCACHHGYEPSISKQVCLGSYIWSLLSSKTLFHHLRTCFSDINECLQTPNPCSFDCRNTEGSFECVCPKGYQVDSDSVSCVGKYMLNCFIGGKTKILGPTVRGSQVKNKKGISRYRFCFVWSF